jgi:4-amino-4-deoxy-L-arabinose transferase-like glycosyltransferase
LPKTPLKIALLIVLIGSAFLRCYDLADNPPGLFYDEASTGYDAYCLLHTGADRYGEPFPLFFRSFGDYVSGLYRYLAVPFVAVLGLDPLAVRLPSALISLLTVWLTFAAVRRFWDERTGVLAAALVGMSPWVLPYARSGHRVMLLPFFLALFLAFAARVKGSDHPRRWALAAGFAIGAAMLGYASGEVVAPLLLVGYVVLYRRRASDPDAHRFAALGFAVVALPLVMFATVHPEKVLARLMETSGARGLVSPWDFAANLLRHYDPRFLFGEGDANYRHSLPGYGQLHRIEAPLLVAGLIAIALRRRRADLLVLLGLAVFAVPAALTRFDLPHGLRSVGAVPFVHIAAAIGAVAILDRLQSGGRKTAAAAFRVALVAGLALTAATFARELLVRYPRYAGPEWRAGYREAIARVVPEAGAGRRVVWFTRFANLDPIEFLFFANVPPGRDLAVLGDIEFERPTPPDFSDPRVVVVLDAWAAGRAPRDRPPDAVVPYADGAPALLLWGIGNPP